MRDVSTFIIAGGKSARMGSDKAFMLLADKSLIDHAIYQAKVLGGDIFIVGQKEKFTAYGRVVVDVFPDSGPLGGIHAALRRSETDLNLMLPVDAPFVKREYLIYLYTQAKTNGAMVTVSKTPDGLQPLCGIYRKEFGDIAEEALQAGRFKVDAAYPKEGTRIIDLEDPAMIKLGFTSAMFNNLNTPEEFKRAEQEAPAKAPQVKKP